MKRIFWFLLLLLSAPAFAQKKQQLETDKRVAEGFRIYRSEMASWQGSDLFVAQYPEKEASGGYISYEYALAGGPGARCVFYSKGAKPQVLATFTFDSSYNVEMATVDFHPRALTPLEQLLMELRSLAGEAIQKDPLFAFHKGTRFNVVPVIFEGRRKVYVLTGTTQNGVVIMGNDYEIDFDAQNKITAKRKIHRSLLEMQSKPDGGVATAMHSHLPETGDLITPTEVCTLLLYGPFTNWNTHLITSRKFVTIWSLEQKTATVMTRAAMNRIAKDAKKRNASPDAY